VRRWFARTGGALDGIVAKRGDESYRCGERSAVIKVKRTRTADCVVGGFRYSSDGKSIGSLLLGLYDRKGLLNHVGFVSGFSREARAALRARVEPLIKAPGFTGTKPGGPSRWSTSRSEQWEPLAPKLVVEVSFDHVTGERFRHGTGFVRWRPDKSPRQCTMAQMKSAAPLSLLDLAR
jgi:ATP-dependent DNA ligase